MTRIIVLLALGLGSLTLGAARWHRREPDELLNLGQRQGKFLSDGLFLVTFGTIAVIAMALVLVSRLNP